MVSGIEPILDAVMRFMSSFGSVHVFRDYSDKRQRQREEKAWRKKHGTDWDKLK